MAHRTGTRVAVLGTGTMGAPMARRIARSGATVTAWNRSREKAEALAESGVSIASTAAEAVRGCEVVVTLLSDAPALDQVMAAEVGEKALAATPRGALWLQMSTLGLDATERFAREARVHDVRFVDAPVLGTRQPAERGELVVLASGEESTRELAATVFDAVASRTLWIGTTPGQATRLKLVVNTWVLGLTGIVAETLAVATRLGVDPLQFLEIIRGGPLDAGYAHTKGALMMKRRYERSFALRLALKDAGLILDATGGDGHPELRMLEGLVEHLARAERAQLGDLDMAAMYEVLTRKG